MQRTRERRMIWIMILAALLGGARARASIIMEDWALSVSAHDSNSSETQLAHFGDVTNPFQDSHAVSIGTPPDVSTAAASYDFIWSASAGTGSFDVAAELTAFDVPASSLDSQSAGRFRIRTSMDTLLTINAEYTFDLPPFDFITNLQFDVVRLDPFDFLLGLGDQAHSFDGHNAGTISLDGSVVIPGDNALYEISYLMRLSSLGGNTAQTATGEGFVHFNLAPVPEPATAALVLLFAGPLALRRRR